MLQAITVKYLPTTDRYKASCYSASLFFRPVPGAGMDNNAREAAYTLVRKLHWGEHGVLVGGSLPNGDRVFVFDNPCNRGA